MDDHNKTKSQLIAELHHLRLENRKFRDEIEKQPKFRNYFEKLFMKIFELSPVSIQILDKNGNNLSVNNAHTDFFGVLPPPNYNVLNDPILLDQKLDVDFKKLQQGEVAFFKDTWYNAHLLNPDYPDRLVWIKTCGIPVPDEEGNLEYMIIIHEDITESKKLETKLQEKNHQLNQLTEYLNKIREEERENLSSEIHDTFSTALAAITRRMKAMKENMTDVKTVEMIDYLLNITDDARNLVHKIIAEIRTDKVKNLGLYTAIKAYARYLEENHDIKIKIDADETKDIDQDLAHKLYRIVQESLVNVVQHAQSTEAHVILKKKNGRLLLSISDNGIGLSAEDLDLSKNHGIFFMKKRIENLGGTFSISGKKNKGSIIKIDIAVEQKTKL